MVKGERKYKDTMWYNIRTLVNLGCSDEVIRRKLKITQRELEKYLSLNDEGEMILKEQKK